MFPLWLVTMILMTVGLILLVFTGFPWAANGSFHLRELQLCHIPIGVVFMLSCVVFKNEQCWQ